MQTDDPSAPVERPSCGFAAVAVPSTKLLKRGSPLILDSLCGGEMTWHFSIDGRDIALEHRRRWKPEVLVIGGRVVDENPATDWFSPFRHWATCLSRTGAEPGDLELIKRSFGFSRTLYQAYLDGELVAESEPWDVAPPDWTMRISTERKGYLPFCLDYIRNCSVYLIVLFLVAAVDNYLDPRTSWSELIDRTMLIGVGGILFAIALASVHWKNFVSVNRARLAKLRAHLAAA